MASASVDGNQDTTISNQHWVKHRKTIHDLYVIQRLPLTTVRRHLYETSSFSASESQYKRKFKEWGLAKNMKASVCQAIGISLELHGRDHTNATAVVKGVPLSPKRLQRALRRHHLPTLERKWTPGKLRPIPKDIEIHAINESPSEPLSHDTEDVEQPGWRGTRLPRTENSCTRPTSDGVEFGIPPPGCYTEAVTPRQNVGIDPHMLVKWSAQLAWQQNLDGILPYVVQTAAPITEIRSLLAGGASINALDDKSWTALHHAVSSQNVALVQFLLETGASPEGLDVGAGELVYRPGCDRETPLSLAVVLNNPMICGMLFKAGATLKMTTFQRCLCSLPEYMHGNGIHTTIGQTPLACCFENALQFTVMSDRVKMLGILLECNANMCNSELYSPLFLAIWQARIEILDLLLKHGADVNAPLHSHLGQLDPVQAASYYGNLKAVSMLVEAGANVNGRIIDIGGRTALQHAVERGDKHTAMYLLERGADVNALCSEDHGLTALQSAVLNRNEELVELLLHHGADVNQRPAKIGGYTALSAAIKLGSGSFFRRLIKAGANVRLIEWPTCDNCNIHLLTAVRKGGVEFIKALLHYGLDVNVLLATGQSLAELALLEACQHRSVQVMKLLLQHCSTVKPYVLYEVCDNITIDKTTDRHVMQVLLEKGADFNVLGKDGSLFEKAFRAGNLGIIHYLLKNGAQPDLRSDRYGRTALQVASAAGDVGLARLLIHHSVDVNALSGRTESQTALQAACEGGYVDLVKLLLHQGAHVNLPACPDHVYKTLQSAVRQDHVEIVQMLLTAGADVVAAAQSLGASRMSINIAAGSGRLDVVKMLLDRYQLKTDASILDICARAAEFAEANGHWEVVELLETYRQEFESP